MVHVMTAEHLRKIKHELRTPVNHIIGYSELLMETAADAGDHPVVVRARSIHANGHILARLIEKNLSSPPNEISQTEMNLLRSGILPVLDQLLAEPSDLVLHTVYAEDFAKIHRAANNLRTFVDGSEALF